MVGTVTVFVDDAVLGRLPSVCVYDGAPTADRLTVRTPVGAGPSRIGAAWLLVFLGPVGWLVLAILALTRSSGEVLSVTLPCSEQAHRRQVRTRRNETAGLAVTVALVIAEIVVFVSRPMFAGLWALLVAVGIFAALAVTFLAALRLARTEVRVSLDGSRRWVTIANAHATFVFAAWEQVRFQQALRGTAPVS